MQFFIVKDPFYQFIFDAKMYKKYSMRYIYSRSFYNFRSSVALFRILYIVSR
jgi:hypothetical protein